ncbi:MAG: NUDIX domain-containing protein, partial [Nitrosomonadales bacterium]|nr:NUDIX domain-containing protein [Nitrosomonadales bacterium]
MIDKEGYRANVAIVIINNDNKVLWAKRTNENAWQFPQGGIKSHENAEEAMFRELKEEVGIDEGSVEILGKTSDWLYYDVPKNWISK